MTAITILVWTCVFVFVLTCLLTLLGLVGILRLGGGDGTRHDFYLRWLFRILLVEIVAVGVSVFAAYVGVDNKQIQGLKDLVSNSGKTPTLTTDSAAANETGLGHVISSLFHKSRRHSSQAAVDSAKTTPKAPVFRNDTLSISLYVTTDGPKSDVKIIDIPANARYTGNQVTVTTGNGDYARHVELIPGPADVKQVRLVANVADRRLFGPRNWFGAILRVFIQRQM